jgi:putative peptidoglycan lipid II flippase
MDSPETAGSAQTIKRQIARAAGTVMIAFIISNIIGLLRGIVIYRTFGTSEQLDSFNAANRVTEVLYNLMAGGALGSAFIPTFTGFLTRKDQKGAWKLASGVINLLIIALIVICILGFIFAPQIVQHGLFILDPSASLGQVELTTTLLRILLPSIILFGVSGLVMGMLNSHQVFLVPQLAPAMYSIGMIAGVFLLPASWGIYRLAWGALMGSAFHLLVQLPTLIKLKFDYRPIFGWKIPEVREVFRLFLPRIFGVAIVQLNFIVNTIIALSLVDGSVSAITLAFSLMLMPEMVIAQSIAIASLPSFSAQVELGKLDDMRSSLAATLRGVLLLAIPASLGLILLREPLIRFLYQNGSVFTSQSTQMVAWGLLWYAAGLVGHSVVEIVSRAFYALHDTRTPVFVGATAMAINLGFSFLFSWLFGKIGWLPLGGLALANSLATALEMTALILIMRKRLNGLEGKSVWDAVMRSAVTALVMGGILWGWLALMQGRSGAWTTLGGLLIGAFVYGIGLVILKVPEVGMAFRMIGNLIRRKRIHLESQS